MEDDELIDKKMYSLLAFLVDLEEVGEKLSPWPMIKTLQKMIRHCEGEEKQSRAGGTVR